MNIYNYKAKDINGRIIKGKLKGWTEAEVIRKLVGEDLYVYECEKSEEQRSKLKALKEKQIASFAKEMSLMIRSGLSIVKILDILSKQESLTPNERAVYAQLYIEVRSGVQVAEAMRKLKGIFPDLLMNMVHSGELGGTLSSVLEKMAKYYQAEYRLKKKIKSALRYPKILIIFSIIAMLIIFTFVLPTILEVLEDLDQELPRMTSYMFGISNILRNQWYLVIIGFLVVFGIVQSLKRMNFIKYQWDCISLSIPLLGQLLKVIYTARFARTLGSLYSSGINLVLAITVAADTIGNVKVEEQFPKVATRIRNGESLSHVIGDVVGLNQKLKSIIEIGEETGQLDEILIFSAESFEYDADMAIDNVLALIEPVMLLLIAVLIGTVVISALLPIFQLYEALGSL